MLKSNLCNIIYQVNNINSPLSDILLLRYENDVLHENYLNSFVEYTKDNNLVGINIKTKMLGGAQVTKVVDLDNILIKLYNLELVKTAEKYIDKLNIFFNNNEDIKLLDKELINNTLIDYFDKNVSTIFSEKDKLYDHLIQKYVNNLKYDITNKDIDVMEFLSGTTLFKSVNNIYIGTSGYNTNKTNHWDVIYEVSNNNLELYSNHFNSIEINDTYYQDFDSDYWNYLEGNLSSLEGKMSVSLIFNKELSDILLNHENLTYADLEVKFNEIFIKYYEDKISIIEEYIDNLVEIGLKEAQVAIESGAVYTQKYLIDKNVDLDKALECCHYLRKKGVTIGIYVIFGFPGESRELMEESLDFIRQLPNDWVDMLIASPLVGSVVLDRLKEGGIFSMHDSDNEMVKIAVEKQTTLKITGADKQQVGAVASKLKTLRKIEPYKGKGVREKGQYVLKKEGKKK